MYLVDSCQGLAPSQPDYRSQYEVIRGSVSNVVLEADFMLNENRAGISANDREQAVVLARNGKFVETQLRLMQELQDNYADQATVAVILDKLHLVQKAQMRYMQEEYSCLQVGGQFGQQTKSIFKAIRRQTTAYTPALIEDIKTAVNVTGVAGNHFAYRPPHPQSQYQQPQFQFRSWGNQFCPRRPFFNNFNQSYQPRQVPYNRENGNDRDV